MPATARTLILLLAASSVLLLSACRPRPQTSLAVAAATGDTAALKRLAASGADLEAPQDGLSPLIWAARNGRVAAIDELARLGADVNRRGGVNDWTPLEHAIHTHQPGAIRALLEDGAEASGAFGAMALNMAASNGDAESVGMLLDRGVDPRQHPQGASVVLIGAVGGSWDIDQGWSGCDRHTAVTRLLLERVPGLRLGDSFMARAVLAHARFRGCDGLAALVEPPASRTIAAHR